jgi:hypothetical protein
MRSSTLPLCNPLFLSLATIYTAVENRSRTQSLPHLARVGWLRARVFSPATTNTCCGELHFGRPSHQRFLSYTRHSFPPHTLAKHSSSPVSNFNHPRRRLNTQGAGGAFLDGLQWSGESVSWLFMVCQVEMCGGCYCLLF